MSRHSRWGGGRSGKCHQMSHGGGRGGLKSAKKVSRIIWMAPYSWSPFRKNLFSMKWSNFDEVIKLYFWLSVLRQSDPLSLKSISSFCNKSAALHIYHFFRDSNLFFLFLKSKNNTIFIARKVNLASQFENAFNHKQLLNWFT